jgi:hypothetical protein
MTSPFTLIAGLDPAIQKLSEQAARKWLDARVKPGHEGENLFCSRAGAMP